jgi:hypothetical protein
MKRFIRGMAIWTVATVVPYLGFIGIMLMIYT